MHIPQNPILEYNLKVVPPGSGAGNFTNDDLAKGVLLISRNVLPDEKGRTQAGKANTATQQILGVLSETPNIAYTRGVLVVQKSGTDDLAAADMDRGIIPTTTPGKAAPAASAGGGWGRIVGGGNDPIIGRYFLVLV